MDREILEDWNYLTLIFAPSLQALQHQLLGVPCNLNNFCRFLNSFVLECSTFFDKITSCEMALVFLQQILVSLMLVCSKHLAGNSYIISGILKSADVGMFCIWYLWSTHLMTTSWLTVICAVIEYINLSLLIWRVHVCQTMLC